eukprot:TRINITY_DN2584_c0_g1_i1.p1 TRINITY_DN2584_c0_g1~~TRINITY_DN2584_c0_g1_i1.p1  ORF type:complete len:236 (-),score=49.59 TRINITY_DN2584_c0_g1_i1:395-1000(-)
MSKVHVLFLSLSLIFLAGPCRGHGNGGDMDSFKLRRVTQRKLLAFPLQGNTICTPGDSGVKKQVAEKVCEESKIALEGLISATLASDGALTAQYYGPNLVVYAPSTPPIIGNTGPSFDFFVQIQLKNVCQCITKSEGTSQIIAYKNRAILRNFFKLEYLNGTLLATGHEIMTMVKSKKNKVTKWVVEWEAFTFGPLLKEEE